MYLPADRRPSASGQHRHQARWPGAQRRLQPRADDQPRRQAVRVLLEPKSVQHRPVRRRCDDRQDHQEARRSVERSALRRDQLHQLGRRLVAGRREVRVHRLRRGRERDRDPQHEVDERRASHQAAGHRLGQPRVVVARRAQRSRSPVRRAASAICICSISRQGTIRQLTNDKYADIQPTWSPDGKTIAFSTDRGAQTDFNTLKYSPLQLATYDMATGRISVFSPFARGKHINPQFSPNGQDLFFISDQDGFPDVYRLNLGERSGVPRHERRDGRQRHHDDLAGAVGVATDRPHAVQHVLRSGQRDSRSRSVADGRHAGARRRRRVGGRAASAAAGHAQSGHDVSRRRRAADCRPATTSRSSPITRRSRSTRSASQALACSAGGPFGPGVAGGVSMIFGDQLSDRQIFAAIQANGTVKDIGGALQYYNMKNRWNYGAGSSTSRISPAVYSSRIRRSRRRADELPAFSVNQLLQRDLLRSGASISSHSIHSRRRNDSSSAANITHYGFDTQLFKTIFVGNHDRRRERDEKLPVAVQTGMVRRTVGLAGRRQFVRGIHVARARRALSAPVSRRRRVRWSIRLGVARLSPLPLLAAVHVRVPRHVDRPLWKRRRGS